MNNQKTLMQYFMEQQSQNPTDVINLDVPLLIRLLEYSRESIKDDVIIHKVAAKLIKLSKGGNTLTMKDYNKIITK
jgi:hypothetical protein